MKKFYSLVLGVAFALSSTLYAQSTETVTIDVAAIGGTTVLGTGAYNNGAERSWITNGISFGGKAITSNQNNTPAGTPAGTVIQTQANNGVIYNTTALPGRLVSVTLNYVGTAQNSNLFGGTTTRLVNSAAANYTVTDGTQVGAASSTGWTATDLEGTNYTYFAVKRSSGASYLSSIVIEYEEPAPVCTAPVIVSQPTDVSVVVGSSAAFTVDATGDNLTYQWQVNNEGEWLDLTYNETVTTSTFSIPVTEDWMNESSFRVVISSGTCTTISNAVTLTIQPTLAVGDASASKVSLVKNTVVANSILFNAKSDVQIVNMNGQVVKTASVNENTSLDVATLPKGTYVVTGVVNGKSVSQKIIKK